MFGVDFAVLGVVSVPDLYSKDIIEDVVRDFDSMQRGGVDGILFENEGYKGANGNALPRP
jgi:predicted TIM-barrel enzyme